MGDWVKGCSLTGAALYTRLSGSPCALTCVSESYMPSNECLLWPGWMKRGRWMPHSCPAADEDMPRGPEQKKSRIEGWRDGIGVLGRGETRLASLLLDKTSIHTLLSLLNSPSLACSLFLEPSLSHTLFRSFFSFFLGQILWPLISENVRGTWAT